ncbi:MAG: hypothetical protein HFF99_02920 [Oscillibacter sp.]|nr:hypothetical protein [uncultured Oscillibacter sp.]MCI8970397.1 hypothetical protein [Oscillibacter sp.]
MRANRTKLLGAAALLLVFFASCALLDGSTGWFPVLGNLVSAARMRSYAAQVYPDLKPEGLWARYDPEDGNYFLTFTLKNGGGGRSLYYNLDAGLVTDERRRTVLRKELGIAEHPQVNGNRAYWDARWDPGDPDTPVVSIRLDVCDSRSAPVPAGEAMRAVMADRAMELYGELSPRTPVHTVSVHYSHEAQEDKRGGSLWYSITVELPEDTPLTREMVLSGELESR